MIIRRQKTFAKQPSKENFKAIGDLAKYVKDSGLRGRTASKFQRVNAQKGSDYARQFFKENPNLSREEVRGYIKNGIPLRTVASDGVQETKNLVTKDHVVLNNVGNGSNKWAVEKGTFNKKYQAAAEEGAGVYKPSGKPMKTYRVKEDISFKAPWGEEMKVKKGGKILQDLDNPNDIYGISKKDFKNTYKYDKKKKK